jgi:hypothetical protein
MARKTWRCFFCDEVFYRRQDAAEHFGASDREISDEPACQIKAHEGHLVRALRKAHQEIKRHLAEDDDVMQAIMALEAEIPAKVQRAEEDGYGRGVRDVLAQSCPACVERVRGPATMAGAQASQGGTQ